MKKLLFLLLLIGTAFADGKSCNVTDTWKRGKLRYAQIMYLGDYYVVQEMPKDQNIPIVAGWHLCSMNPDPKEPGWMGVWFQNAWDNDHPYKYVQIVEEHRGQ